MISHSRPTLRTIHAPGLVALAASIIVAMGHRWRERRALARLDARLLRDIGLSRDRANAEIGKMPWRN